MTYLEAKNALAEVNDKLAMQGRIVDARLLDKQKVLKEIVASYEADANVIEVQSC